MGDAEHDALHKMFKDMLKRTDGWRPGANESSLDYNFMTRHPEMSMAFIILTSTAAVLGNIGNIMVIGAVLSYRPLLRNKGNMFVINLALADICITSIVCPMNMIGVTKGPRFFLDKVMLCNMLGSICTVSCLVSMMSIAAVAVNRLIQITKYFMYHRIYTHKKTILYCVGLWCFAILLDLGNWLGWGGHTFGLKEMGCTFDRVAKYSYTIFLATMSIFIPMVIVLGSYLTILLYVRHSRMEMRKFDESNSSKSTSKFLRSDTTTHASRRKSTYKKDDLQFAFILFVSFLMFVICWTPYMVALVFDRYDVWPKEVYVAGTLLGHTNSCLNPIIYAMGYARFRKGYYVFIHKIFCLKITNQTYLKESRHGSILKYKSTNRFNKGPVTDRLVKMDDGFSSSECQKTPTHLTVSTSNGNSPNHIHR